MSISMPAQSISVFPPKEGEARRTSQAQGLARLTGLLFLVTFAASIPAAFTFYAPALKDPSWILGSGSAAGVPIGALLEMILIFANIGTAIAVLPVLRKQSELLSIGFITARVMESVFIAMGIVSVLALASLRTEATGADVSLVLTGQMLVAVHDWTFLLGPGFVVGIGNGLILGYLMYRSRLVPRAMSILGLIGGPALVISGAAIIMGAIEPASFWQIVATVPEFFWELSLGIWLLVRGFNPAALAALNARAND